jgi:hypothetical protein
MARKGNKANLAPPYGANNPPPQSKKKPTAKAKGKGK